MKNNLEIIQQIENIVNQTAEQKIILEKVDELNDSSCGYTIDKQGFIAGLSLVDCNIKNLNELTGSLNLLENLEILNFRFNQIIDISAIKDLKNLTYINFGRNQITDISAIKDLKKLTTINFSHNQITDISAIKDLKKLTTINFSHNHITDISAIKDLKKLTTINFSHNQIINISAIRNLEMLTDIDFSINEITDISAIKDLKNLTYINFGRNQITDISAIKDLKNLTNIYFSENQIINISAIRNLEMLTDIDFSINEITDISSIKDLKNLKEIYFTNNQITDISVISNLQNLRFLNLSENQIKDISPIKYFYNKLKLGKDFDFAFEENPLEIPAYHIYDKGIKNIILWHETNGFKDYINRIRIKNYFSIEDVELEDLKNYKEIYLLGENGVGKTILLQAILMGLRNENKEEKVLKQLIENQEFILGNSTKKGNNSLKIEIESSANVEYKFLYPTAKNQNSKPNVFAYGVNRSRFTDNPSDHNGYLTLFGDLMLKNPVRFLEDIQRKEAIGVSKITLNKAIELLENVVNFENETQEIKIEHLRGDFSFIERGTKLKFEQLSDGYKSALTWLSDLLSCLVKYQPDATSLNEFNAIVLVDEIDLLLHPRWAYRLMSRLRELFPNIQWFISTHSPVITLGASKDAVFYTLYKENGKTKVSEQLTYEMVADLMSNSILTSPLFGMEYAGMIEQLKTNSNSVDTNDSYLYSRINKFISQKFEEKRKKGQTFFSPNEIDSEIKTALDKNERGEI